MRDGKRGKKVAALVSIWCLQIRHMDAHFWKVLVHKLVYFIKTLGGFMRKCEKWIFVCFKDWISFHLSKFIKNSEMCKIFFDFVLFPRSHFSNVVFGTPGFLKIVHRVYLDIDCFFTFVYTWPTWTCIFRNFITRKILQKWITFFPFLLVNLCEMLKVTVWQTYNGIFTLHCEKERAVSQNLPHFSTLCVESLKIFEKTPSWGQEKWPVKKKYLQQRANWLANMSRCTLRLALWHLG